MGLCAAASTTLTFNTVSGGPTADSWKGQWQLSSASTSGGWIVQNILEINPSGWTVESYSEAWQVPAGSQYTTYHDSSPYDDTFAGRAPGAPAGDTIQAQATFYPGLQLPTTGQGAFVPGGVHLAGDLPATTAIPNLPTCGTAPVSRTWTAP